MCCKVAVCTLLVIRVFFFSSCYNAEFELHLMSFAKRKNNMAVRLTWFCVSLLVNDDGATVEIRILSIYCYQRGGSVVCCSMGYMRNT